MQSRGITVYSNLLFIKINLPRYGGNITCRERDDEIGNCFGVFLMYFVPVG